MSLSESDLIGWVSPEFLILILNILSGGLGSSDEVLHDALVIWVHVIVGLSGLEVTEDSYNIIIGGNIWEVERLSIDLFGHGLQWLLWASGLSKGVVHLHGGVVVRNVEGLAEQGPLSLHGVNLLLDLRVLLGSLLLLLLLSELSKLLLGILLLLLELSEDLLAVLLLELLLLSGLGEAIRSMSQSHLAVLSLDVKTLVLGFELSALLLELRGDLSDV